MKVDSYCPVCGGRVTDIIDQPGNNPNIPVTADPCGHEVSGDLRYTIRLELP
jgi:hypothetical protein